MIGIVLVMAAVGGVSAQGPVDDEAVARAIERAVVARIGSGFTVRIADLSARLSDAATHLEARPVPGVRLGQAARFALFDASGMRPAPRVGDAVATVFVSGPAVKAARGIERGTVLTADDMTMVTDEISGVLIAPLPRVEDVTGAQTLRDIVAGEMLTTMLVRVPPAVVSGQLVTTVARVGHVNVESRAVAAERGALGQIIRLVNPESRRNLRGTVIGPGRVEVLREP